MPAKRSIATGGFASTFANVATGHRDAYGERMKLSKGAKLGLLALTLWPVIYVVLFFFMIALMPRAFPAIFIVHGLTMLLVIGLLVFYVAHLFKAPQPEAYKKIMWLVLLLWGNLIAMPIYFFAYVWPDEGASAGGRR
jgi:hypothetical protein